MLAALVTAITSWATISLDVTDLLPGTQVKARGLRWEVVHSEPAGPQKRCRLRCLEGALDEDPVGAATGDELGHDEAGLDRLAQADAVSEEEARSAHGEGAHDRDELVRGDVEAAGLDGEEGARAEGLLEEEGVVIELPAT